ncbi:methyltransferase 2 domain-containing protein [Citrus sinensis]|nr:methyltransferase 2 domain-containing protein [Citrus sinensis]
MEDNECKDGGKKVRLAIMELANMISVPMSLTAAIRLHVPDAIRQGGANTPLSASQILTCILPSGGGDAENLQRILCLLTSYSVFSEHREFRGERRMNDVDRPTSNPLPPQSEAFADHQNAQQADAAEFIFTLINRALCLSRICIKVMALLGSKMRGSRKIFFQLIYYNVFITILDSITGPSIPGVTHIGGGMFKSIPAVDAIFMKWVLTTWTDDECKLIMENCYKALPAGGELIACEPVLPDDSNESQRTRALLEGDIFVMTIYRAKGKHRIEQEFKQLGFSASFPHLRAFYFDYFHTLLEFQK